TLSVRSRACAMLGDVRGARRLRRLAIALALTAGCGGATHATSAVDDDAGSAPPAPSTTTSPAPSTTSSSVQAPSDPPDAGADASHTPSCIGDLTNIGTADFTISFDLQTTQTGLVTLVYQRPICKRGMFWDVRLNPGGIIGVEIDDGHIHYTLLYAKTPIDD